MKYILFILIALLLGAAKANSTPTQDSLFQIYLSPISHDTLKANVLAKLGFRYMNSNLDSMLWAGKEGLKLSEKSNYTRGKAKNYNIIGIYYAYQSRYDSAAKYFESALGIFEQLNDTSGISSQLNNIGEIYRLMGDYDKTISYYFKSLKIEESLKNDPGIAISLNNIGSFYINNQPNLKKAKSYLLQGLKVFERIKDNNGQAMVYGNLGELFRHEEKYDSAVVALSKAVALDSAVQNLHGLSSDYINLGNVYHLMHRTDEAIKTYERSYQLSKEIGELQLQCISLNNIGAVLIERGNNIEDLKKAIEVTQKSYALAVEIDGPDEKRKALRNFADGYEKLGDAKLALTYFRQWQSINDSIFSAEKNEKITEIETRYQTEKKEQENSKLKAENATKDLELSRKNNFLLTLAIAIILLLAGGLIFYQRYKARKEKELSTAIIKEREEGLKAVFDATEQERRRIAKDLHDGVGQQMSALKLQWSILAEKMSAGNKATEADLLGQLTKILDDAANDVRKISHQMMPRTLQEKGLAFALSELLKKSFLLTDFITDFDTNCEDYRLDEKKELSLYRIAQELLNNVIKHSKANQVSVQLIKSRQWLTLVVEDNGVGIANLKSDGIGLMSMNSRISTVNGDIHLEPSPNSGTVATVRIPIA